MQTNIKLYNGECFEGDVHGTKRHSNRFYILAGVRLFPNFLPNNAPFELSSEGKWEAHSFSFLTENIY